MSIVRSSLALAFSLTLAGTALARQPPSLVAAQQADEARASAPGYRDAYARSSGVTAERGFAGNGYRDSVARFSAPQRGSFFETQRAVCPSVSRDC